MIRSRLVTAGGVRIHYSESGEDRPVMVGLHVGGAGSSAQAGVGPAMPGLGEHFRHVAHDFVGAYGLADPNAPAPYGIQGRIDHLEASGDALCPDRFSIMRKPPAPVGS